MALKSASMAYLNVPQDTIRKAGYFLDSVQTENGSLYGYTSAGRGSATSAIGLLCRMYMGWKHENPALIQGVQILSEAGPSLDDSGPPRNNMYYNYYATQVLHHYGGYEWVKWNGAMRDYLDRARRPSRGTPREAGISRGPTWDRPPAAACIARPWRR